jgi:hypothetical protein
LSIETPNRYKKAAEKPDRRQADRVAGKGRKELITAKKE